MYSYFQMFPASYYSERTSVMLQLGEGLRKPCSEKFLKEQGVNILIAMKHLRTRRNPEDSKLDNFKKLSIHAKIFSFFVNDICS